MSRALSLLVASSGVWLALASSGTVHERSLSQAWTGILEGSSSTGHDTPVTRVVNLLKEMGKTVQAEMDEDEGLFQKLRCWCNDNDWEKSNAIEASEAKIDELNSTIHSLIGSTAELRASIKELEGEVAADKQSLAEATALREKQLADFHNMEKDSIQAVENLKAALAVLAKHHSAPPESSTVGGGAIFKSVRDRDSFSFVQIRDLPSSDMMSFDNFMRDSGMEDAVMQPEQPQHVAARKSKFLQQGAGVATESEWSEADSEVIQVAVRSAVAFMQSKHSESYYPAYNSQSGEIVGVLKQLKEEMEADLSESQKREQMRAASFAELRAAKTQEIESGEKMSEEKEDQLAQQDNALAHAREDLEKEEASLSADQKFMKNLKATCAEASTNFDARKSSRMTELKAISETIEILQGDSARDAMTGTFSFMQRSSSHAHRRQTLARQQAATKLRSAARSSQDPQLSVLATSVELDAFTKVKKAIDDMVSMLRQQQKDEVSKNDWCKAELQSNEMSTAKKDTQRSDLEAKIAQLQSDIKALIEGIATAKSEIASSQLNLQRASEDRKRENLDFQKVVADQATTIEVLHQALDRLATYYDLVQTQGNSWIQRQTPDVVQMEYSKSKSAPSVMQMIEKLVYDARELTKSSQHAESEAQAAYEQLVADTNDSVAALQREVVAKTAEKVGLEKDERQSKSDLSDTISELAGLAKYNGELHTECDYLMKNFDLRQQNRMEEIEALIQAKQILSGAALS